MRNFRVAILVGIVGYGFYKGGEVGAFYAFILAGITLSVLYMVFDCFYAVASFLDKPKTVINNTTNNTLKLEGSAMKGQPEAYPVILEARREGKWGK